MHWSLTKRVQPGPVGRRRRWGLMPPCPTVGDEEAETTGKRRQAWRCEEQSKSPTNNTTSVRHDHGSWDHEPNDATILRAILNITRFLYLAIGLRRLSEPPPIYDSFVRIVVYCSVLRFTLISARLSSRGVCWQGACFLHVVLSHNVCTIHFSFFREDTKPAFSHTAAHLQRSTRMSEHRDSLRVFSLACFSWLGFLS